ncbi:dienelactone hydrolase [Aureobasidium sp. EXF-10727]|nr:dienelactone hydrolase [Aureobasidium sp. EXF-10727]
MSNSIDQVLAKPADLCCLKGSFHSGEPQGKTEQIDGVETYVATPDLKTANGNVLLYFPDAFGLHTNSYLLMDAFASCGYLTLGVDYFLADAVSKHTMTPLNDPNFDLKAWSTKHLRSSEQVASRWAASVMDKYGKSEDVKFACVGYCWGARIVCQQLATKGICKVGAMAHPSFMNESHVSGVHAPLYIAAPSADSLFQPEQRARTVEILTQGVKHFNMQIYSNVGHGFATRGNLSDPYERWAKEECFKSFVGWLDYWLSAA